MTDLTELVHYQTRKNKLVSKYVLQTEPKMQRQCNWSNQAKIIHDTDVFFLLLLLLTAAST